MVALGQYGVQARNLRVLRASAERETALIEQVVAPILRQRSPGARDRASQTAQEIASLVLAAHAALIEMMLADAGFSGAGPGGPAAERRARACPLPGRVYVDRGILQQGSGRDSA